MYINYSTLKKLVSRFIDNYAQDNDTENMTDDQIKRLINNTIDVCYEMGFPRSQSDMYIAWIEKSKTESQVKYYRTYIDQYNKWFNQ